MLGLYREDRGIYWGYRGFVGIHIGDIEGLQGYILGF